MTRWLGITKVRKFVRVCGVSADITIVPFNHTLTTLERAVKERVFFVKDGDQFVSPPRPKSGYFFDTLHDAKEALSKFLPRTAPLNYQQFVDTYRGRKKEAYTKALFDLRNGRTTAEQDSHIEVFTKYEKVDRTSKADPVPRVISPRDPKYNLRVGRYIKRIEEPIFKALGKLFGHKTVIKGLDMDGVAKVLREKWDMFTDPVAVGLDASRFDQHVSKEALEFEHSIYLECFAQRKHRERLHRLLDYQLENHCTGYAPDGKLDYTISGTRMSGDMNTSLGNCLLMCLMVKSYLDKVGVHGSLANNGDDCVVFMEKSDLQKFMGPLRDEFHKLGFNMQVEEPAYEFEHVEFCQTKPVFDGRVWTMCRNPITAIAKDSVMLHNPDSDNNGKFYRLWLHAVGIGGIRLSGGLPVFQNFYRLFHRSGHGCYVNSKRKLIQSHDNEYLPWFMRQEGLVGKREFSEPTPQARLSFWNAWGITPDEQLCLEKHYDSMSMVNVSAEKWFPRSVFSDP